MLKKNLRDKKKGLNTCQSLIPRLSKEEAKYMILSTCLSLENVKRSFTVNSACLEFAPKTALQKFCSCSNDKEAKFVHLGFIK